MQICFDIDSISAELREEHAAFQELLIHRADASHLRDAFLLLRALHELTCRMDACGRPLRNNSEDLS